YYGVEQRINVHKLGYVGASVDGDGVISFFTYDPYVSAFKIQVEGVAEHEATVENVDGEATYDGFAFESKGDYDVIVSVLTKQTEGVLFDTRGVGRTMMVTRNGKPTSAKMTEEGILISGLTVKNDSSYVAYELDGGERLMGETVKGNYGQLFKFTYPENDSTVDREYVLKLYNAGSSFGGKHLTSLEAVEFRFTVLGKVSNPTIENESLTWDYDGAAVNFCVYASKENSFNGNEKTAVTVSEKSYAPNGGTGADLTFKVFAKGDVTKNTVSGKPTQSSKFSFLNAPTFEKVLRADQTMEVFWTSENAAESQNGYTVYLPNGETAKTTEGRYLFDADDVGEISVRAEGDGTAFLRSVAGVKKTLAAIDAPEISIDSERKKLSWRETWHQYVVTVYDSATESVVRNGADGATEISVDGFEAGEYYLEIFADGESNSTETTLYYNSKIKRTDFVFFTYNLIPQRFGFKVDMQPNTFSTDAWRELYEDFYLKYALKDKQFSDTVYTDEFEEGFMPLFGVDDALPYWGSFHTFSVSLNCFGTEDFWTKLNAGAAFVDKTEWAQKMRVRESENENRT
ncbi:MAG: hypothetical protein IJB97_08665, partial [Clostridia bacterium]|nr:hypothetical protein [Clostridia bacterium]